VLVLLVKNFLGKSSVHLSASFLIVLFLSHFLTWYQSLTLQKEWFYVEIHSYKMAAKVIDLIVKHIEDEVLS
jgi:hypothetical protein